MQSRIVWRRLLLLACVLSLLMSTINTPLLAQDGLPDGDPGDGAIAAPAAVMPAEQHSAGFTITVNTLVDEWSTDTNTQAKSKCSLREALQATVSGNPQGNQGCGAASIGNFTEYDIVLPGGTYLLTRNEQLPNITKKIVIDGKGAVTIDGNGKGNRAEGIFIVGGGELILSKLKLQNGWRPFGGAIWVKGGGAARVTEVEFYRNVADNTVGNGDGGAVAVDTGAFYCVKSKFNENRARNAGGAISSGGVQVLLDRCDFFKNHAEVNGGAYAGFGGSEVTHPILRDSKFSENFVYQTDVPAGWPGNYQFGDDQSGGGALYNKGYMELERVQFFKNYTQRSKGGGAIYNQGDLRLLDVAISDNKARPDGSAVPLTLGGAVLNDSTLIMRRTSIHENEASVGGAIMNRTGGTLYVVNSTVADNLATSGGGIENGHNFLLNGAPAINNGGTVNVWHSTVVRAKDNNQESTNVGNIQSGTFYLANSIVDSACSGSFSSYGGNIFKKVCQRVSGDPNVDKTLTDVIVQNTGAIQLESLANNGGPNLPEAEFLSVKVGGTSPALDLGEAGYCTDPAIQPLFLVAKDQIGGDRPVGPECDAGALEVGTLPPQWNSDKPAGAGFFFPLTIFGKSWTSDQTLRIENKGGGSIAWQMLIENSAGGVFSLVDGPTSGGLGRNQSTTLTFRCAPTSMGWHDGMITILTDLPETPKFNYPISCAMKGDPDSPLAWRNQPPGPISAGQAPPGGQTTAKISVGNQGANPMAATVNLKDVLGDTIKFVLNIGAAVSAAGTHQDVTVPAGQTMTIDVTCAPNAPGIFTGTLEIATNDPLNPLLSYGISCEGVPAPSPEPLAISATSQELPQQRIMGMALSPDGSQLLAGHWDNNEIAIYSIPNAASGFLNFQTKFNAPGMNTITGIRYSADGKNVYYTSFGGNGIVTANRDTNGALTFANSLTSSTTQLCGVNPIKFCPIGTMGGARALDISPDDQNLYVTGINDDSLTVLTRNTTTGALGVSQRMTTTVDGLPILNGPFGVLVSPDGANVYVAARDADTVIAFSRQANGTLKYLTHVSDVAGPTVALDGPIELAISPDGRFLYVSSLNEDAVQILRRSTADGSIELQEAVAVGVDPYHILISQDEYGERLMVALWNGDGVNVYARDWQTGQLSAVAGQGALAADSPVFLVAPPDGRNVYAALFDGKGVLHMRSQRRAPVVQNLSPASVTAGSADSTLTVNGAGFYADSVVLWNGAPLATTFNTDRQLTAAVPAALKASAGTATVQVRTTAPGGGDSAALVMTIAAAGAAPIPSIASLSPAAATVGGEPLNVVISGAGFSAQSQALLNGVAVKTTYINASTLLVELSATDVVAPGPLAFSVVNEAAAVQAAQAGAAAASRPVAFAVSDGSSPVQAAISGFQPGSLGAGAAEQWITVLGSNFSTLAGAPSVAYWNGAARPTIVQDGGVLKMQLAAADLATATTANVTVFTPGAPESLPRGFRVLAAGQNPVAQVTAVMLDYDGGPKLLVSGDDFVAGAEVRINGSARPTTSLNAYVLSATLTYDDVRAGGLVRVANPSTNASNAYVLAPQGVLYMPLVRR
ncbi:MAG: beta-propeller fold lactonase family protein [Caldilineaceae bacterium]|nr:beta-propeller fold lactonase family protein [Caldilineaceae bacterium]